QGHAMTPCGAEPSRTANPLNFRPPVSRSRTRANHRRRPTPYSIDGGVAHLKHFLASTPPRGLRKRGRHGQGEREHEVHATFGPLGLAGSGPVSGRWIRLPDVL